MSTIHTEGGALVAKFLKNDSDNKWGHEFILIINGHKGVQVCIESIIINGVDYHARVNFFRNKDDISKWDFSREYSFIRRNDQPRKDPSDVAKKKIYELATKIIGEAHSLFPNLFLMADRNFLAEQISINNDKAADLERQAKEMRELNNTLDQEHMVRSTYYNKIIGERLVIKS